MDFDRYFGLSTSSKNYQSTVKSQFGVIEADFCIDLDEIEEDDEEMKGEYPCPFCSEDFDLLGLCCHIDEDHPSEVDSGVFNELSF
ncbi:hypothetical protein Patl1_00936 [Pistacia atlantica]|uniref:Uncharacterized protein n=1 Tax=Pistacia atlantica TaxID=434234 RepID=A0ACC1C4T5_9ROSI|nr:hypothetical protein Patl1_00936 [Pistacia atlantica]